MGYQRPKIIQGLNMLMPEKVVYDEQITSKSLEFYKNM